MNERPQVGRLATRLSVSLLLSLVVLLITAPPAGAQSVLSRKAGVFGGDPESLAADTREVEDCTVSADLTPEQILERGSEHYDRGLVLFEQGDYEGSVIEFVAAYCHSRGEHPGVLLDISKTYERMVNYEKAVAYLDLYIVEAGEEDHETRDRTAYRASVLRNLPAKIRVATVPDGATVTIIGKAGVAAQSQAGAKEPISIRKGVYEMKIELSGYEPITEQLVAQIGQPYSYYFSLEPQRGTIRIFANVTSARIFIDNKLVGVGSYVDTLPIGRHELTVEAAQRTPQAQSVEITAGQVTNVSVVLPKPPKSGRTELITAATAGGAFAGGLALSNVFDDDTLAASSGVLLGGAIGLGGSYFGLSERTTIGTSSYVIGVTLIAATDGVIITRMVCGQGCDNAVGNIGVAAGVVGLGFAAATAERFDMSAGDSALINSGALWGGMTGLMFRGVFDTGDEVGDPLLLLGVNLGVLAGGALAARTDYSRGHVALIDLAGLAGIIAGASLAAAFPEDNVSDDGTGGEERTVHFALGGMTIGLITGGYLTRNRDVPKALGTIQPAVSRAVDATGTGVTTYGALLTF